MYCIYVIVFINVATSGLFMAPSAIASASGLLKEQHRATSLS